MSIYTNKIFDFIDKRSSENENREFKRNLDGDDELKNEFFLITELNEHMKVKLTIDSYESREEFHSIDNEAKEDVIHMFLNGKTDDVVLDYLSAAYPENNSTVLNIIAKAENSKDFKEIDKISEEDVDFYMNHEKKDEDLMNLIRSVGTAPKKDSVKLKLTKRLIYAVSSAAAVFIMIVLINQLFFAVPNNEKLFVQYHYEPFHLTGVQMRNSEQNADIAFDQAIILYEQGLYDESFSVFNGLVKTDPSLIQPLFYSGIAKFEGENYEESVDIFLKVLSKHSEYSIESKWFLALAYIKMNKFDEAVPYLETLSEQKSIYREKASEILEEITD